MRKTYEVQRSPTANRTTNRNGARPISPKKGYNTRDYEAHLLREAQERELEVERDDEWRQRKQERELKEKAQDLQKEALGIYVRLQRTMFLLSDDEDRGVLKALFREPLPANPEVLQRWTSEATTICEVARETILEMEAEDESRRKRNHERTEQTTQLLQKIEACLSTHRTPKIPPGKYVNVIGEDGRLLPPPPPPLWNMLQSVIKIPESIEEIELKREASHLLRCEPHAKLEVVARQLERALRELDFYRQNREARERASDDLRTQLLCELSTKQLAKD